MSEVIDIAFNPLSFANDPQHLPTWDEITLHLGKAAAGLSPGAPRCVLPPAFYPLAEGIADNRRLNDLMLEFAATCDGRAYGVAEPKYEDAARAEIERIARKGAVGVVWSPRAQGVFADDGHMAGLVRFAASAGLVSLIHSAPYSINESLARVWHLAAQCRDLPIVVLGALASWENVQAIQQGRQDLPALYYDISGVASVRDLGGLVAAIGPERFLFGSGGARFHAATLDVVERCPFDDEAKTLILAQNARRLIGF